MRVEGLVIMVKVFGSRECITLMPKFTCRERSNIYSGLGNISNKVFACAAVTGIFPLRCHSAYSASSGSRITSLMRVFFSVNNSHPSDCICIAFLFFLTVLHHSLMITLALIHMLYDRREHEKNGK